MYRIWLQVPCACSSHHKYVRLKYVHTLAGLHWSQSNGANLCWWHTSNAGILQEHNIQCWVSGWTRVSGGTKILYLDRVLTPCLSSPELPRLFNIQVAQTPVAPIGLPQALLGVRGNHSYSELHPSLHQTCTGQPGYSTGQDGHNYSAAHFTDLKGQNYSHTLSRLSPKELYFIRINSGYAYFI